MSKISIGLRGWRFDESEVFDADGEFRPLDEMSADTRERLLRLVGLVEEPCDACYLIHGEREIRRCNQASIVYGEPGEEVVLCDDHEADFLYWYREVGGSDHRGEPTFRNAFHEWFDGGGRAPEGYGGLEHVETDPDRLPDPPDQQAVQERLEATFEGHQVEVTYPEGWTPETPGTAGGAGENEDGAGENEGGAEDFDFDEVDVDLGADYPGEDGR